MIRQLTAEALPAMPPCEAAVRLQGLYAAYGTEQPFLSVYAADHGSVFSVMDGAAVLCAQPEDRDELAAFFRLQPSVRYIRTDAETARWLTDTLEHTSTVCGEVMRYSGTPPVGTAGVTALSPREMYPVLAGAFLQEAPPFEAWYLDVSHRLRHGCCRIAGIRTSAGAVSAAMTVAESAQQALIGAVGTLPGQRGKGYAAACVLSLTAALMKEKKTVWLSPKNEGAAALYRRIGFTVCGHWGSVIRTAI